MKEYIHIVCLDAPSPPDYGGAIDMFCKIEALHSIGKKIILHYFSYKKNRNAAALETCCQEINVYKRSSFLNSLVTFKPHIVSSRISPKLIHRLNQDDYPVLLEGIHCSGIIPYLNPQKKIVVRVHNNEAEYYKRLCKTESNFFRRLYFLYDSIHLFHYQKKLPAHVSYAFLSKVDEEFFKGRYDLTKLLVIPSFIPWQTVLAKPGKGNYCLYHGNLSIPENFKAALWLLERIFTRNGIPFIIAGKDADKLKDKIPGNSKIQLINNPSDVQLAELIQNAHINVVPSMNVTGVKLKLLHALISGRFCMSNLNGVKGSGVENHVACAETTEEWNEMIKNFFLINFSSETIEERKKIFQLYNNIKNAQKLISIL